MTATFLPSTGQYMDPLGLALGQGIASGFGTLIQNRMENQDAQALRTFLQGNQQQYGPTVTPSEAISPAMRNFGAPTRNVAPSGMPGGIPEFKSQKYRSLAEAYQAQQLQGLIPQTPLEQAQVAQSQAMAEYYRSRAQLAGQTTPPTKSELVAQEMQRLDSSIGRMEAAGKTGTARYKAMKRRRDELYGLKVPDILTPAEKELQSLDLGITREQLKALESASKREMTPEQQKVINKNKVSLSRLETLQAERRESQSPQRVKLLDAQIRRLESLIDEQSPAKEIAKLKLDAIKKFPAGSPKYLHALGLDSSVDLPTNAQEAVTEALQLIRDGEEPRAIFDYLMQNQPQLRRYAIHLKRILLPTSIDLFDVMLREQLRDTGSP